MDGSISRSLAKIRRQAQGASSGRCPRNPLPQTFWRQVPSVSTVICIILWNPAGSLNGIVKIRTPWQRSEIAGQAHYSIGLAVSKIIQAYLIILQYYQEFGQVRDLKGIRGERKGDKEMWFRAQKSCVSENYANDCRATRTIGGCQELLEAPSLHIKDSICKLQATRSEGSTSADVRELLHREESPKTTGSESSATSSWDESPSKRQRTYDRENPRKTYSRSHFDGWFDGGWITWAPTPINHQTR